MGNNESQSHAISTNLTTSSKTIKILSEKADQFSKQKGLDTYSTSVIRRIFVQPRQSHLIEVLRNIQDNEKLENFIDQIHNANIEILDSFYEHILYNSQPQQTLKKREFQDKQRVYSPFDRQIGVCGTSTLMRQSSWEPLNQNRVQFVNLKKVSSKIPGYEKYKEKGLNLIKNQEVCFIILAGGRNIRYDLKQNKQCDDLDNLPSKSSLIELMLKKFQALGRLIDAPIHIYIMVNDEERKKNIRKIKTYKIPNPQYIQVDFLTQINYGCLDHQGRLVLTDDKQVYFHPNGNGDIWGNFQDKNLQKTGLNKYKYVQIFGVSNILQHCFDCYMIGKLANTELPWITMASQNIQGIGLDPVMYLNHQKHIQVRDPQQIGSGMDTNGLTEFPKKAPHIFLNNTVFSMQFIMKAVSSPRWLQFRKYHCKHKKIDFRPPLSKYSSIFCFERQISDIFAITDVIYPQQQSKNNFNPKFMPGGCCSVENRMQTDISSKKYNNKKGVVVIMKDQQYNSPYYTKFDRIMGAVALSQMYKNWLGIGKPNFQQQKTKEYYEEKLQQICEIDPFVSLEGQNLQQIIQQLSNAKSKIEYPLYIGSQLAQNQSTIHRTPSNLKQNKFQKLNEFTGNW